MATYLHGLGTHKMSPKTSSMSYGMENMKVRVRRQDTTIKEVSLMEENTNYLKNNYENFTSEFNIFEDMVHSIVVEKNLKVEGFPYASSQPDGKEYMFRQKGKAYLAEMDVIRIISSIYADTKGAFLWSGFKRESIFRVLQQTLDFDYKKWCKDSNKLIILVHIQVVSKKYKHKRNKYNLFFRTNSNANSPTKLNLQ